MRNGILAEQPHQSGLHLKLTGDDVRSVLVEPSRNKVVAGLEAL
ncbi:Uncharacterised protein [Mycobacteroides abscessus subsp. abscessus]|nr:Uncharacterised protein [Mycobacteroides abscessus subsp. abscessus]